VTRRCAAHACHADQPHEAQDQHQHEVIGGDSAGEIVGVRLGVCVGEVHNENLVSDFVSQIVRRALRLAQLALASFR